MPMARRVLKLKTPAGQRDIAVSLDAPSAGPRGGWSCRYVIDWPDGARRGEGWGVDAVQAIQLTLQMIGTDLYASGYHRAGQLLWEEPGQGYGFPVPANIRDLLAGADARD